MKTLEEAIKHCEEVAEKKEYIAETLEGFDEYTREDRDEALIAAVQQRIDFLYEKIVASPEYKEMLAAEEAVNALMNEVNTTITTEITGEAPCTHDCSTCGHHCHG